MADWKENLDPVLRDYLNSLLKEVIKYRDAYTKSKDIKVSQLWVAITLIFRELALIKSEIEEIKKKLYSENEKKNVEETLKKY